MTRINHRFGLAIALLTSVTTSFAAATTYFGYEVPAIAFTVGGAPAAAKGAFLANVSNVGTENFDARTVGTPFPCGTPPCTLDDPESKFVFAGRSVTGTVSFSSGFAPFANSEASGSQVGRFDTTKPPGSTESQNYLEFGDSFVIDFNEAIAAFGFYGTDISDFNGTLRVTVVSQQNTITYLVKLGDAIDCPPQSTNCDADNALSGNLLFWGIVQEAGDLISSVTIRNNSDGDDGFGLDDIMVADRLAGEPDPRVPEPASVALVGLALLGGAAARKFAKR